LGRFRAGMNSPGFISATSKNPGKTIENYRELSKNQENSNNSRKLMVTLSKNHESSNNSRKL
jgi:hypothetical protein